MWGGRLDCVEAVEGKYKIVIVKNILVGKEEEEEEEEDGFITMGLRVLCCAVM